MTAKLSVAHDALNVETARVDRLEHDQDGFRKDAQEWMNLANQWKAHNVKLVTALNNLLVKHGLSSDAAEAARNTLKDHGVILP
jgi:hypothetical protein